MRTRYVIYDDSRSYWFVRLGLGMFWECTSERSDAKEFETRAKAAKVMQAAGKHRDGWRVLQADGHTGEPTR